MKITLLDTAVLSLHRQGNFKKIMLKTKIALNNSRHYNTIIGHKKWKENPVAIVMRMSEVGSTQPLFTQLLLLYMIKAFFHWFIKRHGILQQRHADLWSMKRSFVLVSSGGWSTVPTISKRTPSIHMERRPTSIGLIKKCWSSQSLPKQTHVGFCGYLDKLVSR